MSLSLQHSIQAHNSAAHVVCFNPSGTYSLTGGADRRIVFINNTTGAVLQECQEHGYPVYSIDMAQDESTFVSSGGDRAVIYWDTARAAVIRRLTGHTTRKVNSVCFNDNSSMIASGGDDTNVLLWDLRNKSASGPVQKLEEATDGVTTIAIRDCLLFTTSMDGVLRTYDIRKGELREDTVGEPITSFQESLDGLSYIMATTSDTFVRLDAKTGQLIDRQRRQNPTQYRLRAAFMKKDSYIVAGDENGSIVVRDAAKKQPAKIFKQQNTINSSIHRNLAVEWVAYSEESSTLVTSDATGLVCIWGT